MVDIDSCHPLEEDIRSTMGIWRCGQQDGFGLSVALGSASATDGHSARLLPFQYSVIWARWRDKADHVSPPDSTD